MARIKFLANPFDKTDVRFLDSSETSVNGVIGDLDITFSHATLCYIGDKPAPKRMWNDQFPNETTVTFVALPADFIFTPIISFLILNVGIPSLLAKIIVYGGALLIANALVPKPKVPRLADVTASPTYSIAAQGNTARYDQAIPFILGTHIVYPDFAAEPYVEYPGDANDQFLFMTYSIGIDDLAVSTIRIEDTPIDHYQEVEFQLYKPGEVVDFFNPHVYTAKEVGGQEALGINEGESPEADPSDPFDGWHGGDSDAEVPDFGQPVNVYDEEGNIIGQETYDGEFYDPNNSLQWPGTGTTPEDIIAGEFNWLGGFVINKAGTEITKIGIDVFVQGLYTQNTETGTLVNATITWRVRGRRVDDKGAPLEDWKILGDETLTDNTPDVIRRSYYYPVESGRYEVQFKRTNDKIDSVYTRNTLLWAGARGYTEITPVFEDVTILQIRAKATNNLTEATSRLVNVVASSKVPVWNGTTWERPKVSRNPYWLAVYIAKHEYGGKLTDSSFPLAEIKTLADLSDSRGDYFDGIFDSSRPIWDAIQSILSVADSAAVSQGQRIRFFRDTRQTVPVAFFTNEEIKTGFNIQYAFPGSQTPDGIEATFFDRETWEYETLTIPTNAVQPQKTQFFGITSKAHVIRRAKRLIREGQWRRMLVSFSVGRRGRNPTYSDAIFISHDLLNEANYAEIVDYDSGSLTITCDRDVVLPDGSPAVAFRNPDGSPTDLYPVTAGAQPNILILGATPDVELISGDTFGYGLQYTWTTLAKVFNMVPAGDEMSITAVIEDVDDNGLTLVDQGRGWGLNWGNDWSGEPV